MPYTQPERRKIVDEWIPQAGDLVYCHYKRILEVWHKKPCFNTAYLIKKSASGGSYVPEELELLKPLNEPLPPALEGLKVDRNVCYRMAYDEFKRRILDPYEDKKIQENGDVK